MCRKADTLKSRGKQGSSGMESNISWVTFTQDTQRKRQNCDSLTATIPGGESTVMPEYKVPTRQEARVLAGQLTRQTRSNWLVEEHDGYFEVVETKLVPNFKVGDRVHWKEAPNGVVGIIRKDAVGIDKIVGVYWGTSDGNAFIGNVPSRQLELDAEPFKTNYS